MSSMLVLIFRACFMNHIRFWLYLVFIVGCAVFFTWMFGAWKKREYSVSSMERLEESEKRPIRLSSIPPLLQTYCNFPIKPIVGDEGALPTQQAQLLAVTVVTRHGDRAPLLPIVSRVGRNFPPKCGIKEAENAEVFMEYRNFLQSDKFRRFLIVDKAFQKWPISPVDELCASGQLTAIGAVQLIKLGRFLKDKYAKWNLFQPGIANFTIFSSMYSRTFQSAIALSYGLYPTRRKPVYLKPSDTTYFCTEEWCYCPKQSSYKLGFEKDKVDYFRDFSPKSLQQTVASIAKGMFKLAKLNEPLELLDTLGMIRK